jgi:hypothetical protein
MDILHQFFSHCTPRGTRAISDIPLKCSNFNKNDNSVSTHQSALGQLGGLWLVLLMDS